MKSGDSKTKECLVKISAGSAFGCSNFSTFKIKKFRMAF